MAYKTQEMVQHLGDVVVLAERLQLLVEFMYTILMGHLGHLGHLLRKLRDRTLSVEGII